MKEARLILTCGLPGAGKTTLATSLAAERGAVRLTKDEWLWALGSSPWDRPTGEKIERELWRLAQEILGLGLSVVLDFGLWARIERDDMRTLARGLGVGVELHYLEVPTDELWRRVEARNAAPPWDDEPIGRADLDEWLAIFQPPDAAELALFDRPMPERESYGRTKSGVELTDEVLERMADEAKKGFDVTKLRRRPGRPAIGSAPAESFPVRLDPELRRALDERAAADDTPASEIVREALRRYLKVS